MRLLETQKTIVPGRIYERQVRVPVEDCGCEPRGLFGCLHKQKAWATVAVQAPPRKVCQTVYRPQQVVRNVSETRYVTETMVREVPVQTCTMVAEERIENIPVTTCRWSPRNGSSPTRSEPARWSPRNGSRTAR